MIDSVSLCKKCVNKQNLHESKKCTDTTLANRHDNCEHIKVISANITDRLLTKIMYFVTFHFFLPMPSMCLFYHHRYEI